MGLLHVTDFHFRQRWFHWLTAQAACYAACGLSGERVRGQGAQNVFAVRKRVDFGV